MTRAYILYKPLAAHAALEDKFCSGTIGARLLNAAIISRTLVAGSGIAKNQQAYERKQVQFPPFSCAPATFIGFQSLCIPADNLSPE